MGATVNNQFHSLIYLLTRVYNARDFETGIALNKHLLGKDSRLHLNHIFPKSKLYEHGYLYPEVNAIANFTFLTEETNQQLSNRDPAEYFDHFEKKHPGILTSHWISMDRELWQFENY